MIRTLALLLTGLFPWCAPALSPDEPWARGVMRFKDERLRLITCGTTHGPRAFTRPLPNTLYFCLARPEPFDGRSVLVHQSLDRRGWRYFEIFGCRRVASEVADGAGYLAEACEAFPLSERGLQRRGRPFPFRIRTEWDENVGGLQFHFRHEGHVYNGIPMNLYELRGLNR